MPSPRPLILPLIRSCNPNFHHLFRQPLRSQIHRYALPIPFRQTLNVPQHRPYSTPPQDPKVYTFEEIAPLATSPSPRRILIDVREPSELQETGRIPGAYSMPLTSNPDAFYLSDEDFFDRFGFEKPHAADTATGSISSGEAVGRKVAAGGNPFSAKMKERETDSGLNADGVDSMKVNEEAGAAATVGGNEGDEGIKEVIFYCKAGVRSRAAARMAREWGGLKVGQYAEGWMGWEKQGGKSER